MNSDQSSTDAVSLSHWGLIDRIYETGQSPHAWPLLLDSLFNNFSFDENPSFADSTALGASLRDLWPHFERALSLNTHIEHVAASTAASTRTDFPYPLVVVTATLDIIYRSVEGIRHFPPQSGVEVQNQKVIFTNSDVENRLSAFMNSTKAGTTERFVIPLYCDENSKNYLVAIYLPRMSGDGLLALGWFDPADRGELTTEHFRQLYDLTNAESNVLHHILCGEETSEVADFLSITPATVRTHLKSVYRKTSTTGKSELIHAIRCGPALLGRFLMPRNEMYADTENADSRHTQTMTLSNGRRLGFAEFGTPDGVPVLLVHNMIGSRLQLPTSEDNLIAQNLRLIVPDRPGVGLSDIRAPLSLQDWSSDINELADHLELEQFNLIGSSIGAIYALALAHHQPDRIRRLAMVSCLPEITDMRKARHLLPSTCKLIFLARVAPALLAIILKFVVRRGPEAYLDQLICDLPPLDQQLCNDPAFNRMIVLAIGETLRQGTTALLNDIRLMARPWHFAPESIRVPVDVWHGLDDTMAPYSMTQAFAGRIPDCRQYVIEKESHWLMYRQWNTIVAELLRPPQNDSATIERTTNLGAQC